MHVKGPTYTKLSGSTVNSWTAGGEGCQPLVHSDLSIQDSSVSADSANHRLRTMVAFTIEENSRISGPVQFKPVRLKGQLY